MSILGTRVIRTEDPRLLTVGGVYVDDLRVPELDAAARVTFVRSAMAHALITGIDTSEALREPGVVAVLTAGDMDDLPSPAPASESDSGEVGGEEASGGEGSGAEGYKAPSVGVPPVHPKILYDVSDASNATPLMLNAFPGFAPMMP